jgi:hypothetical protein
LTPCLHQPTFLADLAAHKEERDPLFFALLMSTLACTLVQVPKSYIPVESTEVRRLAARCFRASRAISHESYDPPVVDMVVIRFFDNVYHFGESQPSHYIIAVAPLTRSLVVPSLPYSHRQRRRQP